MESNEQRVAASGAVADARAVLTCRLVDGKVTFVHRRLWPAPVRRAPRLDARGLAAAREEHPPQGRHATTETPFPRGVPAAGAVTCIALVVVRVSSSDWHAPALAAGLLAGIVVLYALVRPAMGLPDAGLGADGP